MATKAMSKKKPFPTVQEYFHTNNAAQEVFFTFIGRASRILEELDGPTNYSDTIYMALGLALLDSIDHLKGLIKAGLDISVAIAEYERRVAPAQRRGIGLLKEIALTNILYTP